jgi:GNAT superfamily N-acetyltransferase
VRLDDAEALIDLWGLLPGRLNGRETVTDIESAIRKVLASDRERIVVAAVHDQIVGGLHLHLAPLAPLLTDLAVFTSHLHVSPEFRRRGVARSLMEAAVTWAEENGLAHVVAMSSAHSRDANRFMARLGLAPAAVLRVAPTGMLRAKLPVEMPGVARPLVGAGRSHLGQVLAQRRSLRRSQGVS